MLLARDAGAQGRMDLFDEQGLLAHVKIKTKLPFLLDSLLGFIHIASAFVMDAVICWGDSAWFLTVFPKMAVVRQASATNVERSSACNFLE